MSSSKCHKRSNHIEVEPETIEHLNMLAAMCGYKTIGKVVDKLVREKIQELKQTGFDEE